MPEPSMEGKRKEKTDDRKEQKAGVGHLGQAPMASGLALGEIPRHEQEGL